MRVVVERVKNAKCMVNNKIVSEIEHGFLLLVGFNKDDTMNNLDKVVKKIAHLRIFEDENHKLNKSLKDVNGQIMSISQFTLYASMKKSGNRPSFSLAMPGKDAILLYNEFNLRLQRELNQEIKQGVFGADMKLSYTNDGPCTIILDSIEL